ncbi:MAG: hypothetical protein JRG91_20350, partial [Deltaproteobacteria bacterium]|nr:hypothetical protein [Deltaproteobacteria bacterium]
CLSACAVVLAVWSGCGSGDDGDPLCDNGVLDPGETCDPPESCPTSCDDGDECTADSRTGRARDCNVVCTNDPIIDCTGGDGCCPEGCDTSTDPDCPPDTFPRLVVVDEAGVMIWNNADLITGDRAPDATLGGLTGRGLGLAVHHDRLFVASDDALSPVFIYDGASTLEDGSTNDETIPVSAFGDSALATIHAMEPDGSGNLWVGYGYIRLFMDADSLTSSSSSRARYIHEWGDQIFSMAYDEEGGKLLGGQVSGAGVIVWDAPLSLSGESNEPDWTLHDGFTPTAMAIHADRLYVGSNLAPFLNIWYSISSQSSPAAPDVSLSELSDVRHIHSRGSTLVLTMQDFTASHAIAIFLDVASITSGSTPDVEIMHEDMELPWKAHLTRSGDLYVMDLSGILVFADATTSPTLRVHITTDLSSPNDMLLME